MVLKNSPSDHITWSIRCHVGIHVYFTSILHSHTPLVPQAYCAANLDRLRLSHQWECLKCNGHILSVSCVKCPQCKLIVTHVILMSVLNDNLTLYQSNIGFQSRKGDHMIRPTCPIFLGSSLNIAEWIPFVFLRSDHSRGQTISYNKKTHKQIEISSKQTTTL